MPLLQSFTHRLPYCPSDWRFVTQEVPRGAGSAELELSHLLSHGGSTALPSTIYTPSLCLSLSMTFETGARAHTHTNVNLQVECLEKNFHPAVISHSEGISKKRTPMSRSERSPETAICLTVRMRRSARDTHVQTRLMALLI